MVMKEIIHLGANVGGFLRVANASLHTELFKNLQEYPHSAFHSLLIPDTYTIASVINKIINR